MNREVKMKSIKENDSNYLEIYLRDIQKFPLLTREEEIELAEAISAGDFSAKQRFREANLRLVVFIAKTHIGFWHGMSFLDLIQEGNLGLFKAVDRYKPCLGLKFSTFASKLINYEILNAITNKSRIIKIPAYLLRRIYHNVRILNFLKQKIHREIDLEETQKAWDAQFKLFEKDISYHHINVSSLNAEIMNSVVDSTQCFFTQIANKEKEIYLQTGIEKLTKIQQKIVKMFFGFDEFETAHSFLEIAVKNSWSRDNVQREYHKAILKLTRHFYDSVWKKDLSSESVEKLVEPKFSPLIDLLMKKNYRNFKVDLE